MYSIYICAHHLHQKINKINERLTFDKNYMVVFKLKIILAYFFSQRKLPDIFIRKEFSFVN